MAGFYPQAWRLQEKEHFSDSRYREGFVKKGSLTNAETCNLGTGQPLLMSQGGLNYSAFIILHSYNHLWGLCIDKMKLEVREQRRLRWDPSRCASWAHGIVEISGAWILERNGDDQHTCDYNIWNINEHKMSLIIAETLRFQDRKEKKKSLKISEMLSIYWKKQSYN